MFPLKSSRGGTQLLLRLLAVAVAVAVASAEVSEAEFEGPVTAKSALQRRAVGAAPRTRTVAAAGFLRLSARPPASQPDQDLDVMLVSGAGDGKPERDLKAAKDTKSKEKPKTAPASDTNISTNDDDDDRKTLSQQIADGKYGLLQKEIHLQPAPRPGILSYGGNPEVPRDTAQTLGGLEADDIWLAEDHVLVLRGGAFSETGVSTGPTSPKQPPWPPIDDYNAPPRQVKIPARPKVPPPFPVRLADGAPTQLLGANGSAPINLPSDSPPFFGSPPPFPFGPPPGAFPPLGNVTSQGGSINARPVAGAEKPTAGQGALPPAGTPFSSARNGSLYGRPLGSVRPESPTQQPGNSPPGNGALPPFFPFPFPPPAPPRNGTAHFPSFPPGLFPPFPIPGEVTNGTRGPPFPPPPPGLFPPGAAFLPPPRNLNDTFDEDDPSIYYPPPYDFFYPKDNSTEVPPGPLVPGIILPPPPDFFAPLKTSTTSTTTTTSTSTAITTTTSILPISTTSTIPTTTTARTIPPRRKKPRPTATTSPPIDSAALNQVTTEDPQSQHGKSVQPVPEIVAVSTPSPISYVVVPVTEITVRAKQGRPGAASDISSNAVLPTPPKASPQPDRAPKASYYFYEEPEVEQGHLSDVGVIKNQRGYYKDGYYYEPVTTQTPSPVGIVTTVKAAARRPTYAEAAPTLRTKPAAPLYLDISVSKPAPRPVAPHNYYASTPAPPQYYYYKAPSPKHQSTTPAPPLFFNIPVHASTPSPVAYYNIPAKISNPESQYYTIPHTTPNPQYYNAPRKIKTPAPVFHQAPNKLSNQVQHFYNVPVKAPTPIPPYLKPAVAPSFYKATPAPFYNTQTRAPNNPLYYYVTGSPVEPQQSTPRAQQILQALQALQALRSNLQFYNAAAVSVPGGPPTSRPIYQFSYEANAATPEQAAAPFAPTPDRAQLAVGPQSHLTRPRPTVTPPSSTPRTVYEYSFENQQGPSEATSGYVTTPLQPLAIVTTTPGTLTAFTKSRPQHAYYTPQDERLFDDITKNFFTVFGQKLGGETTTPMPVSAGSASSTTAPAATAVAPASQPVHSLEDDIAVNYRQPLPSIEPEAEFISYPLPGNGAHFYFLTPQAVYGSGSGRQRLRYRRRKTPR